ncbi:polysaccharide biosynthesis protein [Parvibaculum lavamentivorans DS-1]|uniref:Polysaccharide biosynthesis protein n=1 Tax=Parvibaculum lavamentivorans (strain DS-1 / DSM 13023 / NCIMB 13966) TaxID=402881 RepID=A7HUE2_PARL1|nr:lipopolysaccharide biosynthesis protein [Parvibaculum lavamentivorans]ABS63525.1 polysaccharide biosynthesis protein [Parvibaculum lavamentivorans DS-1]
MSFDDGERPGAGKETGGAEPARHKPGTLVQKSLTGAFWTFGGSVVQAVMKMLVLAVLARLLTPHDFGVVGAAMVVVGLLNIFTQLGVGPAIVQRVDLTDTHIKTGQTLSLAMGFITGAIFYFSAPAIEGFFRIDGVADVVRVLAFVFPLKGMAIVAEGLLQRNMRFRDMAAVESASYIFGYAPAAIVLAALGWGAEALAIGLLAQAFLLRVAYRFLVRQKFSLALDSGAMKQLLNYGGGHTLARLGNFSALNADNLVVGRWLGAEALGIYARSYQLIMQPANLFGTVVDKVLFPAMASVQDDKERLARAYERLTGVVAMITLPLSFVLIVLADELILTVLGGQWGGVVLPFQILVVTLVFRTAYKLGDSLWRAVGATYRGAARQWTYAAAVLAGAAFGQFWGISGVATGVGIAIAVNFWLTLLMCRKLINISLKKIGGALLRHFAIALAVGGIALAGKLAMLEFGVSGPVILVVTGALLAVCAMLAYRFLISIFGAEGEWLRDVVVEKISKRKRSRTFGR